MRRGLTIVQDPTEAVSPEMPRRAIKYAASNHTLGVDAIAELMTKNLKPAVISPSAGAQDVKMTLKNKKWETFGIYLPGMSWHSVGIGGSWFFTNPQRIRCVRVTNAAAEFGHLENLGTATTAPRECRQNLSFF